MCTLNNSFLVTCACGGDDNDDTGDTTDNVDNDDASGDISLVISLLYLSRGGLNIIVATVHIAPGYHHIAVITFYINTIIETLAVSPASHSTHRHKLTIFSLYFTC